MEFFLNCAFPMKSYSESRWGAKVICVCFFNCKCSSHWHQTCFGAMNRVEFCPLTRQGISFLILSPSCFGRGGWCEPWRPSAFSLTTQMPFPEDFLEQNFVIRASSSQVHDIVLTATTYSFLPLPSFNSKESSFKNVLLSMVCRCVVHWLLSMLWEGLLHLHLSPLQ